MSCSGRRRFRLLPFAAFVAALGASCGPTDDEPLFETLPIGGKTGTNDGGTGGGGGPPMAGSGGLGRGGGTEPVAGGGMAPGLGGRGSGGASVGGRGGGAGSGAGGAAQGGDGNEGGVSGDESGGEGAQGGSQGGSGAEPGAAGSGGNGGTALGAGGASAPDCDDGNACTVDRLTASGVCVHDARECDAPGPCATSTCDPTTGACVVSLLDDGVTCDDGNACTEADQCTAGVCSGVASDIVVSDTEGGPIPDGSLDRRGNCERSDRGLEIELSTNALGAVASLEVALDFRHEYVTELDVRLQHVESGREVVLFHFEGEREYDEGSDVNGVYVFTDSALVPFGPPEDDDDIEPGTYAPREPLSRFAGAPVAGTWRLVVVDTCGNDDGRMRGMTLRIRRSCE